MSEHTRLRPLVLALLSSSLLLGGCWNRVEINDLGISIAAALDAAPKQQVRFSEQIAIPGQMGGGRGGPVENKPYYTFSGTGEDLRDAMQNLQTQMSRRLFLAHRRVFLIGETIARQDIRRYLDEISRNPQSRLRTSVAITHGDALRYLQAQYPFERIPAEGLRKVLFGVSSNFRMDLRDLMIMLATPGSDAMIPIIEMNSPSPGAEPKFKADGIAILHKGRMVGTMRNGEANGILWLRDEMKKDTITASVPHHKNNQISFDMLHVKSAFKVQMKNGHPAIEASFQPEGDISENNTNLDMNDPQNIKLTEQALSDEIKHNIEKALDQLQHRYDADVVKFGDRVHHAYPQQWPQLVKNWDQEFAQMPTTIVVDVKVRRVGMVGPSPAR